MKPLLYLLSFATLLTACGEKKAPADQVVSEEIIPVRTVAVTHESTAEPIRASGLVASETEARLSFKTGGIVQRIFVREGQAVRRGQLLAVLNLTEINAQVQQAAEAVGKAERDLQRVTNLYRDSVATLEQVQNLTTALNVARNNLAIGQYNQSFSEIRATTAGVVVRKFLNEGEVVSPGAPVLLVNATGRGEWIVKAGVADRDWVRLKAGNRAEVRLDAYPNQAFTATVSNLSMGADPTSGLYQVELKLTGEVPPRLAAGIFATVRLFPGGQDEWATIPVDALLEGNNDEAFVYVLADGQARRRAVRVASLRGDRAYVRTGLENVSQVITEGSAYLTDGAKVRVVGNQSSGDSLTGYRAAAASIRP
jgi:RND family efflux transporter MFP subunit